MADAPRAEITTVRIAQEIPVVFADAVSSQSYGFGVVKMFFSRYDPEPGAASPREAAILQLIMPAENFVRSVIFLEHRLRQMVANGAVPQALVDESRQWWVDHPNG